MRRHLILILVALDELANTLFLRGEPWETVSGSTGRAYLAGTRAGKIGRYLIDGLLGQGHCVEQAAREEAVRRTHALFDNIKITE